MSYVAVKLVQVEKQALRLPDVVSVKNILTYFVCATLIFTTITVSFDFFLLLVHFKLFYIDTQYYL